MSQDEKKDSMERIADALEEKNEMFRTVGECLKYAIWTFAIVMIGLLLFIVFAGQVYDFFYYDVFGNEVVYPSSAGMLVTPPTPIDDCNYSEDEQFCYQMKRVADALESQNKPSVEIGENNGN